MFLPVLHGFLKKLINNTSPLTKKRNVLYYCTSGTYQWTVPAGIYSIDLYIESCAGGGAGGGGGKDVTQPGNAGGGAGGNGDSGKYLLLRNVKVFPGEIIPIIIPSVGLGGDGGAGTGGWNGSGGGGGGAGGAVSFGSLHLHGGGGGSGGQGGGNQNTNSIGGFGATNESSGGIGNSGPGLPSSPGGESGINYSNNPSGLPIIKALCSYGGSGGTAGSSCTSRSFLKNFIDYGSCEHRSGGSGGGGGPQDAYGASGSSGEGGDGLMIIWF